MALFEGGPAFFLPALHGLLVALVDLKHKLLLQGEIKRPSYQPADVRRLVTYAELLRDQFDQFDPPLTDPHLSSKT